MIYLWTHDKGWQQFDVSDEQAWKNRGISIGSGAHIGARASIWDGVHIGDGASIWDGVHIGARASIGARAHIGTRASIGDGAHIGDGASIGNGVHIGDGASIWDDAHIGARAHIGDGAIPQIIYIIGSSHSVSYWGEDRIDIGCYNLPIAKWFSEGEAIGKREGFTAEQVSEYHRYVMLIAATHEAEAKRAVKA